MNAGEISLGEAVGSWWVLAALLAAASVFWEWWLSYRARMADAKDAAGRQEVLAKASANPFLNVRGQWRHAGRYLWPGIVLIPLRVAIILCVMLVLSFIGFIICLTTPDLKTKPLTGWRRTVMHTSCRVVARIVLWCFGFLYVTTRGTPASSTEAPIVLGNHRGPFEGIWLLAAVNCCMVSNSENRFPIQKYAMDAMQAICVDKKKTGSAAGVIDVIKQRATEGGWPSVTMFPEGTCTNGKALIRFKVGAFVPGVPVQPVAFEFPNTDTETDPSWVLGVGGPAGGLVTLLLRHLATWYTPMRVTYLSPMSPSADERANPTLFAERVRSAMAAVLKVPVTDHEQEDAYLATAAGKKGMEPTQAVVGFGRIKRLWHMTLHDGKHLLDVFSTLDANGTGEVTVAGYAMHVGLPESHALYSLVRRHCTRQYRVPPSLCFREFVDACGRVLHKGECAQLCFDALDASCAGAISVDHLLRFLQIGFPAATRQHAEQLVVRMGAPTAAEGVSASQFFAFVEAHPEHLLIYNMLRKMAVPAPQLHQWHPPYGHEFLLPTKVSSSCDDSIMYPVVGSA